MSGPLSGDQPEAAPREPDGGDHVNVFRAAVIVVAGLVVGVLLLNVAARPPKVSAGTSSTTTTTTASTSSSSTTTTAAGHHHSNTTTTLTTMPPSTVTVQVANATSTAGVAAYYTNVLQGQGWKTQQPTNATTTTVTTSTVYYASGQKGDAESIATELGLPKSAAQPLTTSVPVSSATGLDVVVVAGADLAQAMSTTTTTTAA